MRRTRPPSVVEIFLFPIAGLIVAESVRTRHNELALLAFPLLLVFIRLAWAAAKMPRPLGTLGWEKFGRLAKRSMETEQIAAVFLLLFELAAVILMSPGVGMALGWMTLAPFYGIYVGLRLLARSQWIATHAAAPELPALGPPPLSDAHHDRSRHARIGR